MTGKSICWIFYPHPKKPWLNTLIEGIDGKDIILRTTPRIIFI